KKKDLAARVSRGQYKGYAGSGGIPKNSRTETYFNIEARINNKRWKGVPFLLEAGKALGEDRKIISIYFKERPTCVCDIRDTDCLQNVLEFRLAPSQGIGVRFWAKKKGFTMEVEPRELSFNYREPHEKQHPHDAYEQLLFDAMAGDQTLFAATDEVLAGWKFVTPILNNWHALPLRKYEPGASPA
ncbi:MAG: glucose-6-phosphate dehydrogenase, partial [Patescibacteria group bacterium]|nr:glucose-6-phosphate dehydrogenase [Patescibacteria group bacterium]